LLFSAPIFANTEHNFSGEELYHHFPRTNGHHLTLHDQKSFLNSNSSKSSNSSINSSGWFSICQKKTFSQNKIILKSYYNSASFAVSRLNRGQFHQQMCNQLQKCAINNKSIYYVTIMPNEILPLILGYKFCAEIVCRNL